MAVRHGGDGRHLADEALDLVQAVGGIVNVARLGIDAGKRGHRAHEHGHGVSVVAEAFHEFLGALVDHGVVRDLVDPILELGFGGQLAEQQQVGDLQESAMLGQHFDGIAAVAQDAAIAIDVGDRALAGSRVHEGRVIGHEPEIVGAGLDLPQIHGADGAILNGQGIALSGAVVGDRYGFLRHNQRS